MTTTPAPDLEALQDFLLDAAMDASARDGDIFDRTAFSTDV